MSNFILQSLANTFPVMLRSPSEDVQEVNEGRRNNNSNKVPLPRAQAVAALTCSLGIFGALAPRLQNYFTADGRVFGVVERAPTFTFTQTLRLLGPDIFSIVPSTRTMNNNDNDKATSQHHLRSLLVERLQCVRTLHLTNIFFSHNNSNNNNNNSDDEKNFSAEDDVISIFNDTPTLECFSIRSCPGLTHRIYVACLTHPRERLRAAAAQDLCLRFGSDQDYELRQATAAQQQYQQQQQGALASSSSGWSQDALSASVITNNGDADRSRALVDALVRCCEMRAGHEHVSTVELCVLALAHVIHMSRPVPLPYGDFRRTVLWPVVCAEMVKKKTTTVAAAEDGDLKVCAAYFLLFCLSRADVLQEMFDERGRPVLTMLIGIAKDVTSTSSNDDDNDNDDDDDVVLVLALIATCIEADTNLSASCCRFFVENGLCDVLGKHMMLHGTKNKKDPQQKQKSTNPRRSRRAWERLPPDEAGDIVEAVGPMLMHSATLVFTCVVAAGYAERFLPRGMIASSTTGHVTKSNNASDTSADAAADDDDKDDVIGALVENVMDASRIADEAQQQEKEDYIRRREHVPHMRNNNPTFMLLSQNAHALAAFVEKCLFVQPYLRVSTRRVNNNNNNNNNNGDDESSDTDDDSTWVANRPDQRRLNFLVQKNVVEALMRVFVIEHQSLHLVRPMLKALDRMLEFERKGILMDRTRGQKRINTMITTTTTATASEQHDDGDDGGCDLVARRLKQIPRAEALLKPIRRLDDTVDDKLINRIALAATLSFDARERIRQVEEEKLRRASTGHAELYPKDNMKNCFGCFQSFGFFTWSYHCCWCGMVFCDDCLKRRKKNSEGNECRICRACWNKYT